MKNILFLIACVAVFSLVQNIDAEVFIPKNELLEYVGSDDIYTVVGAVKNTETYPVRPTVHLIITDDGKQVETIQPLPIAFPNKDIPFKIKIPGVGNNAVLMETKVTFEQNSSVESGVKIIYDRSLIKHADGHLSGRIINTGNYTEHDLKIYATVHGENNSFIDVAKNLEKITELKPGQSLDFTMYPDPIVANDVHYYSCFVLGDDTIVPLYAMRGDQRFDFRYDSSASFVVVGFNDAGDSLALTGINSIKFPTYVNFEFPKVSDDEKFTVLVDDKPVKSLQSIDEQGNWHVAFDIDGASQNHIIISGFANVEKTPSNSKESAKNPSETQKQPPQEYDLTIMYYIVPAIVGLFGIVVYLRKRSNHTM